jgi:hypothetical protein
MVPGSCQRRDDYYHEPRYARLRLLASSGAAEGPLWTGDQPPGDGGHRDLRVRVACDKGADREGLEGAAGCSSASITRTPPPCGDLSFQAGHAGSIPVTRSLAVQARTMEAYDHLGIIGTVLTDSHRVAWMQLGRDADPHNVSQLRAARAVIA